MFDSIDGLSPATQLTRRRRRGTRARLSAPSRRHEDLCLPLTRASGGRTAHACGRPISGQSPRVDRRPDPRRPLQGRASLVERASAGATARVSSATCSKSCGARARHARVEGGRRAEAARGRDRPRQEVQAHDRGRRPPSRHEVGPADGASGSRSRPGDAARGGARRRRRHRPARSCCSARTSRARITARRCRSSSRALLSFNSPHGACPRCTGLALAAGDRPRPARPNGSVSIADGALVPSTVGAELLRVGHQRDRRPRDRARHAWHDLPRRSATCSSWYDFDLVYVRTATGWAVAARSRWRSKAPSRACQRR